MKTCNRFNRRFCSSLVASIVLLFACQISFGQDKWNVEFRTGVNFPTKNPDIGKLKTGFGMEGTLGYQFIPNLGAYAGWSWNKFGSDFNAERLSPDFEETGYTFGLRVNFPVGHPKNNFMIRGGGIYNHIELENADGDVTNDSGHGFGWQIEAGYVLPLGEKWQLLPTVRYRALSRDIKIDNVAAPIDLNYISIGLGISRLF